MPEELRTIPLFHEIEEAIDSVDGIVICTEWPQFLEVEWEKTLTQAAGRVVIDANGFIAQQVLGIQGLVYRSVGRPAIFELSLVSRTIHERIERLRLTPRE